jgi:hypothetical protein
MNAKQLRAKQKAKQPRYGRLRIARVSDKELVKMIEKKQREREAKK